MAEIFDLLSAAMGRPDPRMQIAAAMGQAPGQAGSNTGPMPLPGAAGAAPGGGGSPGAPTAGGPPAANPGAPGGGAPGGPGGAGGAAPQPPQPQAYQSPPDLIGMYTQLAQRQQANEGFNRGIGMLAAAFAAPRDRGLIMNAMAGQSGNADDFMRNVIGLQQFNQQQQAYQSLQAAAPALAVQLFGDGADKDPGKMAQARAIIASGSYGSIEANLAGVGGSPAWQAQKKAEKARLEAGQSIPWTPGDPASYAAWNAQQMDEAHGREKDLIADRANFQPAVNAFDTVLGDLQTLRNAPNLGDILGAANQFKQPGTIGVSPATANVAALYNKIMGGQYAAGVQDFKGAGRITQQELKQDLPSQSTMPNRNTDVASFQQSIDDYAAKIRAKRALLFGQAGQLSDPRLSDEDYNSPSMSIYRPGGDLYVPGQRARAPSAPQPAASPASPAAPASGAQKLSDADLAEAKQRIAAGDKGVIPFLKGKGYDTSGLE